MKKRIVDEWIINSIAHPTTEKSKANGYVCIKNVDLFASWTIPGE